MNKKELSTDVEFITSCAVAAIAPFNAHINE